METRPATALANADVQSTLLAEAIASATVGFLVWDEDRHYIAANACACELLGCTLDELLGSAVGDHTDNGEEAVDRVLRERGGRGEIVVTRFDGRPTRLGYVTFPTRTAGMPYLASVIWPLDEGPQRLLVPPVVGLLYAASELSRTVRATARRWQDETLQVELLRERGLYRDPVAFGSPEDPIGPPLEETSSVTRLWLRRPDRLRWETEHRADGRTVAAITGAKSGGRWWQRGFPVFGDSDGDEAEATMSISEEILLDPAPLLAWLLFRQEGETEAHGRPALRVRASRRARADPASGAELGFGGDEWELLVDRERGVVLYLGARAHGQPLSSLEIVEIVYDEPLTDELFERAP